MKSAHARCLSNLLSFIYTDKPICRNCGCLPFIFFFFLLSLGCASCTMEDRLRPSAEFFWEKLGDRGREARAFNRSWVLPVVLLQFMTIVVIVTSWVVTDLDDAEVVEILSWQFFHGFTLVALIAMTVLYVIVNRSMRVVETAHRGKQVGREPPSNFLWGVFALQLLAFVIAVLLFFGGLFLFNPANGGDSSINDRVHVFYLIINILAALTAAFAVIVLILLRGRIAKFVASSTLGEAATYGAVSAMFPLDPAEPSYTAPCSPQWHNPTGAGQRTGFPTDW